MSQPCRGERAEFEAEPYVRGTLETQAAEAFEEHFFACDPCLHHVEALQLAQQYLQTSASRPPSSIPSQQRRFRWTVLFGAAAAAIVITVIGIGMTGVFRAKFQPVAKTQQSPSSPATPDIAAKTPALPKPPKPTPAEVQIARLAEPVMPPYVRHELRGEGQIDPAFEKGMAAYSAKDCGGAVQHLDKVAPESSNGKAARLYAGACYLRLHDLDTAQRDLQMVVEAGDSPQQETAMFLLAQVELEQGHSVMAKHLLERTVSLQGDYERKARSQLRRLSNIKIPER